MNEQQETTWIYFLGRHGNLYDYPRAKCQWYDEPGKCWRRCYEVGSLNGSKFITAGKYRIKKQEKPV